MTPYVIEKTPNGDRMIDVFSRLAQDRILVIGVPISDDIANVIIAQLLFLESQDSEAPVNLYINSPGGNIDAGLAIYDIMNHVKCPIHTTAIGMAASMASLLLTAGKKGKRTILPNTKVLLHQPSVYGNLNGQVTDIVNYTKELEKTKEKIVKIYAKHTGKDFKVLFEMLERDKFLNAEEAVKLGLVDSIVKSNKR